MRCWRRRQRKWEGGRRGKIVGNCEGEQKISKVVCVGVAKWRLNSEGECCGRLWKLRKLEREGKKIFRSGFIIRGIPFNVPRKIKKRIS